MTTQVEQQRRERTEEILKRLLEFPAAKGKAKKKEVERFARHFFRHVSPADLEREEDETLAGAAVSIWQYMQDREPGGSKIRVFQPSHETHGWKTPHSVAEIVNDDMPFLVDSIAGLLTERGVEITLVLHPIVACRRSESGALEEWAVPSEGLDGSARESVMHLQFSAVSETEMAAIQSALESTLEDVRVSVADFELMRNRVHAVRDELRDQPTTAVPAAETAEAIALLEWMDDDHFTFLGYRDYEFEGHGEKAVARIGEGSALGLLRDSARSVFRGLREFGLLPEEVRHFLREPIMIRATKATLRSTVHRLVPLDTVAVKSFDKDGNVLGERLFVGLWTSSAYSASPQEVPFVRHKVHHVMERSGLAPSSHDGKVLRHLLETFPRDELVQMPEDDLLEILLGILNLQDRKRIALFAHKDSFGRYVSCIVFVPRDRYDTALRLRFQSILEEAYGGSIEGFFTRVSEDPLARLRFIVEIDPDRARDPDLAELEALLIDAGRLWPERVRDELVEIHGERDGRALANRWADSFPGSYREHADARVAATDVEYLRTAWETGAVGMNLHRDSADRSDLYFHFKIYYADRTVPLSTVLPMLEHMGVQVRGEIPYDIHIADRQRPLWIRNFVLQPRDSRMIDLDAIRDAFHEVFDLVWSGEMESDGFNRLVIEAGLNAREVVIIRTYSRFLLQARFPFSQSYMEQTLASNPDIARKLVQLFCARFDPDAQGKAAAETERIAKEIREALEAVQNLDEDRIIHHFLNAIESTLRTNFFQVDADGAPRACLSIKIDSGRIEGLPKPVPYREIFCYSSRVEAVHLRGGPVARGGLRWSDRREDFRTEILGLMKAQMVKNAVIVPVGSKGGFVCKRLPNGTREEVMTEVKECYRTFMRGMLDITDNRQGQAIVPPERTVRLDDDDPYLVVAADKGTASFSDIANSISQEHGFWLDDAFASGGSVGYDHKKMGITARGGWEAVRRHFRELNKDIQNEDFTVIGIGDMAGDVFGNGLLLSQHTKLVAAFNHIHIFIDPNPDPSRSFKERQRLFDMPRSSWTDYSAGLISDGGGVFERSAKSIPVSAEMRDLLDITGDQITPNELIRAVLCAQAELLWLGGIGTYVKASSETHLDADDRANDGLRIDAHELRVRVIGEGANLGLTQRARVEFGLLGGHSNTDAIDNSAGVDCSDHEVNIKVLFGEIERAGILTREERNRQLETMTDEVAGLVLRHNYLQTQAITVTHQLGAHMVDRLARFMRLLEKTGRLDRALEFLPDDETLRERVKDGRGLTRPEIAVLLSYAKIDLFQELMDSSLPDDVGMVHDLEHYFPTPLRRDYAEQIHGHLLRREIISTVVTNDIVSRLGVSFVSEVKAKTGMEACDVTRAYIVAREVHGLIGHWRTIEDLDSKAPATLQAALLTECGRLLERTAIWMLGQHGTNIDPSRLIEEYGPGVREITEHMEDLLPGNECRLLTDRASLFSAQGASVELSTAIGKFDWLFPACDIVRIANEQDRPVREVAEVYYAVGERFGLDWLRRAAGHLPRDTAWDKLAVSAVLDDVFGVQADLASQIIRAGELEAGAGMRLELWARRRRLSIVRTDELLAELRTVGNPDLAMLAVAIRQLKTMATAVA